MKTNQGTMAAADWDRVERETVEKIRLLKAVVDGLPSGPLADKICNDLVMPAMVRLGVFNQCVTVQVDQLREGGTPCKTCEGKGGRKFWDGCEYVPWTCPRCKGTGFSHCSDHAPKNQCADCKWAQEKEDRYDQVRCCCDESPNAWGDVESSDSCSSFLPNAKLSDR